MPALRFSATVPDLKELRREMQGVRSLNRRAAFEVTEIASKKAQRHVQAAIRGAGLGKLDKAVGQTSALKKRQRDRTPYGVIFAKSGDRSEGALAAYSTGAIIYPKYGSWLAFPTDAVPRMVSIHGRRERLTPSAWVAAGMNQKVGKLIFKPVSSRLAVLVVRKVSLSPKTGRAAKLGKGRPRTRVVPEKDVVVFILIRRTVRIRRFNHVAIIKIYADRMPDYMRRTLASYERRAA